MNLVDSSGWLAYLLDEPTADRFAAPITATDELVVPSIVILEVYRHVRRSADLGRALQAVAALRAGLVVELTEDIAIRAGELSLRHGLPLADSVVLATARILDAVVWTQDSDFEGLEGVRYIARI